jgi:zinc and cadmium transporter
MSIKSIVEKMVLAFILVFNFIGSIGAIALAGTFLLFPEKIRQFLVPCLVSYATGTLLGAAFLGLIPNALTHAVASAVLPTVLAGIVLFFILEKLVLLRHCHDKRCEVHAMAGPLILIGDAFHNFTDGIIIAVSFVTSIPLGIAASLAVISHEIPQEVGDFAILLDSGYSRSKAFLYNAISAISTLPGALLAYFFLLEVQMAVPYVMALSAASFIYIAMADLFPTLHRYTGLRQSMRQLFLILAGIGTISMFHLRQGA